MITAVLAAIRRQISLSGCFDQVADCIDKMPSGKTDSQKLEDLLKLRKKELDRVIRIMDGLYGDWKGGDISRDEYVRLKAKYSAQERQLETAMETH